MGRLQRHLLTAEAYAVWTSVAVEESMQGYKHLNPSDETPQCSRRMSKTPQLSRLLSSTSHPAFRSFSGTLAGPLTNPNWSGGPRTVARASLGSEVVCMFFLFAQTSLDTTDDPRAPYAPAQAPCTECLSAPSCRYVAATPTRYVFSQYAVNL